MKFFFADGDDRLLHSLNDGGRHEQVARCLGIASGLTRKSSGIVGGSEWAITLRERGARHKLSQSMDMINVGTRLFVMDKSK
jgi:hypothetical protein